MPHLFRVWVEILLLLAFFRENLSATYSGYSGLCSSRARWPLAPNFCSRATRKSQIFHTNHMLGTLDHYSFRALGSLQFSLENSLGISALRWTEFHQNRKDPRQEIQRFPNLGHNLCKNDKQTFHDYYLINYEIYPLTNYPDSEFHGHWKTVTLSSISPN